MIAPLLALGVFVAPPGQDLAAWAAVVVSIVGGGLVMAWRLGALTRAVTDLTERLRVLEQESRRRR